ncbi:integrase catalytic region [Rhodovulum sulfidophilum]|uniref:Integrase catalytic region n=1 Tax=Rhodovulum sulfidophilum TaxID=35806 RepID=A0A0D6B610_RHOSU|nr:integrase catalytic region [Rhodovulum sulfidophilum]
MRYAFIAENRLIFAVRAMCRMLLVHPSGFYAWQREPLSQRALEDKGVVAQLKFGDEFALSHLSSGDGFDLGPAEGREGVHDCDADVNFGGLAFGVL